MDSNTLCSILSILLAIFSIVLAICLHKKEQKYREEKERQKAKDEEKNKAKIVASKEIAFDKKEKRYTIKLRNESPLVGVSDLQIKMRIVNEITKRSYSLNPINCVGGLRPANISEVGDNELLINIDTMTISEKTICTCGKNRILNLYKTGKLTLKDVLTDNTYLHFFVTGINEKQRISECLIIKFYKNFHIKSGHFNKGEMEVKEENIPFNT